MENQYIFDIEDFVLGPNIYSGGLGKLTRIAKFKEAKKYLAIKIISKTSENLDSWESMRNEISIHTFLNHANIIQFYGYFEDRKNCYFMTEVADKGELCLDMQNYGKYTNARAATYINQLACAVDYCHSKKIMHGNIKPESIFLISTGQIRLGDFFHCKNFKHRMFVRVFSGSFHYKAPEVVRNQMHDEKIDIWSFGVLLYEMLTSTVPFSNEDFEKIKDPYVKELEIDIPEQVDSDAKDLISKILVVGTWIRLSLKQILEHPYIERFAEKTTCECKAAIEMWKSLDKNNSKSNSNTISNFDFDSDSDCDSDSDSSSEPGVLSDSNFNHNI